jgi:hypothetical protein
MEIKYEDYERTTKRVAKSFSVTYNIDFWEVLGEAEFQFVRARDKYLEQYDGRANFNSFLITFLRNELINFCKKWTRHRVISIADFTEEQEQKTFGTSPEWEAPDRNLEVCDVIDNLSFDAKYAVRLLLETPAEIIGLCGDEGTKACQAIFRDFLYSRKRTKKNGRNVRFSQAKIKRVYKEVKAALSQL